MRSGKKTAKTRAQSTAEEVLEELAQHHEICRRILEYRSVQKLKSTYVDALPVLANPETGRIHATFNQTVAATGRIAVSDPNLQNIPIRTAEGRKIREAFVADPGWLLLSADYSQIELRVLAHLSKDPTLIDTFRRGEDVHDRTSREVFGPLSPVPPDEQRRVSKMVNYALLYGKTAFTLAKDIGVPQKQAEAFIETYFARYPLVRGFIDETIARARQTGHVRTLLGRLRRLPDLKSPELPGPHGGGAPGHEHARAGLGRRPDQEGDDRPPPRAARARPALAADPADPRRAAPGGARGGGGDGPRPGAGGDGGRAAAGRPAGGGRPRRLDAGPRCTDPERRAPGPAPGAGRRVTVE